MDGSVRLNTRYVPEKGFFLVFDLGVQFDVSACNSLTPMVLHSTKIDFRSCTTSIQSTIRADMFAGYSSGR